MKNLIKNEKSPFVPCLNLTLGEIAKLDELDSDICEIDDVKYVNLEKLEKIASILSIFNIYNRKSLSIQPKTHVLDYFLNQIQRFCSKYINISDLNDVDIELLNLYKCVHKE